MENLSILEIFPKLSNSMLWIELGQYPTPIDPLPSIDNHNNVDADIWIKREDKSSPIYGGNKIRTLEWLFGQALQAGFNCICATGGYGSNHAVATVLHAHRVGLRSAAMLFPQPYSLSARENLEVVLSKADEVTPLLHWSSLPIEWIKKRYIDKARNQSTFIMLPGGATPIGTFGYISAAFELAQQIKAGSMPPPKCIILPVGSTCTTAGLLLGTEIIRKSDLRDAWSEPPEILAVRVTPWPITAHRRIVNLSMKASRLLYHLTGNPTALVSAKHLSARLRIDKGQLGDGYGHPTLEGLNAMHTFTNLQLDTTYSAKAAATLLRHKRRISGRTLFWATKSSAPLPKIDRKKILDAPKAMHNWIDKVG